MNALIIKDYEIAEEGLDFKTLKVQVQGLIQKLRALIQRAYSFVVNKVMVILGWSRMEIEQTFYNTIMDTVQKVKAINLTPLENIAVKYASIADNEEMVNKYMEKCALRLKDISEVAELVQAIQPMDGDKKIIVSTGKLKLIQSMLYDVRDKATKQAAAAGRVLQNSNDSENLKYTRAHLMFLGKLAAIETGKANICIALVTKIQQAARPVTDSKKNDSVDEDAGGNSTTQGGGIGVNMESFLDESAALERYLDAKKIYRKSKVKPEWNEYQDLPESTVEEIDVKLQSLNNLKAHIQEVLNSIGKLKKSSLEKWCEILQNFVANQTYDLADLKLRYGMNTGPTTPFMAEGIKTIMSCIGIKWLAVMFSNMKPRPEKVRENIMEKLREICAQCDVELARLKYLREQIAQGINGDTTAESLEAYLIF